MFRSACSPSSMIGRSIQYDDVLAALSDLPIWTILGHRILEHQLLIQVKLTVDDHLFSSKLVHCPPVFARSMHSCTGLPVQL